MSIAKIPAGDDNKLDLWNEVNSELVAYNPVPHPMIDILAICSECFGDKEPGLVAKVGTIWRAIWQCPDNLPKDYSFRITQTVGSIARIGDHHAEGRGLQEWVFRHSILPLYRQIAIPRHTIRALICGVVSKDGLGDFYHMVQAAKLIQEYFSGISILLCPEVENYRARAFLFANPSYPTICCPLRDLTTVTRTYESDEPLARCNTLAEEATFVLDLPHVDKRSAVKGLPRNTIAEYGAGLQAGIHSMGVGPYHCGLLWNPLPPATGLSKLDSPALKQFLFRDTPSEFWAERDAYYHAHHTLHFAYLHNRAGETRFFIQLCIKLDRADPRACIDIFLKQDVHAYIDSCDPYDFKEIHEIQAIGLVAGVLEIKTVSFRDRGKVLRLINLFPCSDDDVSRLMINSSGPVGCTGDNTFTKILAAGQRPYYEVARHKVPFYESLIEFADFLFGPDSKVADYLLACRKNDLETISRILNEAGITFDVQWKQFVGSIKEFYDFNAVLIDIVRRLIALKNMPGISEMEARVLEEYLSGTRSLKECHTELQSFLNS